MMSSLGVRTFNPPEWMHMWTTSHLKFSSHPIVIDWTNRSGPIIWKESSLRSKNMTASRGCLLSSLNFPLDGICATASGVRVGSISINNSGQWQSLAVRVIKKVGGPSVLILANKSSNWSFCSATNVLHEHVRVTQRIAGRVTCCKQLVILFVYAEYKEISLWSFHISNVFRAQNIHTTLLHHLGFLLNSLDWGQWWVLATDLCSKLTPQASEVYFASGTKRLSLKLCQ